MSSAASEDKSVLQVFRDMALPHSLLALCPLEEDKPV
jgi:hypothetical protein